MPMWGAACGSGLNPRSSDRRQACREDDRSLGMNVTKKPVISGFTLVEMLVVIGIALILAALVVPNAPTVIRSHKMSAAQNLIKNALAQAQGHASKFQKYAGVRFQYQVKYTGNVSNWSARSVTDWEMVRQYLVLIESDPNPVDGSNRFAAVDNAKPVPLPKGIGAISAEVDMLGDTYLDENTSGDSRYCLLGATTFSIIFSPSGQIVTQTLRVGPRPVDLAPRDPIFGDSDVFYSYLSSAVNTQPPFLLFKDNYGLSHITNSEEWCNVEMSTAGLYLFEESALYEADPAFRYSQCIYNHDSSESVEQMVLNLYTGGVLELKE
ncbi:MAG: prepilin-type N-terminal cleavage/methylation domain-containing protein [Sedimentisphaerales bacterium]|nr:prepilin-type N-terminal cleavage/methylation domain-containing protein [Sedimentisphaerales bacterium]